MTPVVLGPVERAGQVHRRLADFARRLEERRAQPCELTAIFDKGGYARAGHAVFSRMARRAVRGKYAQAGRPGVVALLDRLDALADQLDDFRSTAVDNEMREIFGALFDGSVRIWIHASRARCADVDLFACTGLRHDLTPWLFQQPDLRFRVHEDTWPRLRLLLDCWGQYAEHGLSPQTAWYGLDRFCLSPTLRDEVGPVGAERE